MNLKLLLELLMMIFYRRWRYCLIKWDRLVIVLTTFMPIKIVFHSFSILLVVRTLKVFNQFTFCYCSKIISLCAVR